MKFVELTVTVMLKRDIYFTDSGYTIGKNINRCMLLDDDLEEIHPKKQYKNYIFNNFYPLEKDKVYKKDKLYIFNIRGLNKKFIKKICNCLQKLESNDFKILSISSNEVTQKYIKYLYTINPVIVTIDSKPWMKGDNLDLFKHRLEDNLEKKYKAFFNDEIELRDNFIKSIQLKNKKPMHFNYKGIKLLGNKIRIEIKENEDAQNAAFVAMAVGLGEKNSAVGAGFCE